MYTLICNIHVNIQSNFRVVIEYQQLVVFSDNKLDIVSFYNAKLHNVILS